MLIAAHQGLLTPILSILARVVRAQYQEDRQRLPGGAPASRSCPFPIRNIPNLE
jgi:hypothetical protein